MQNDLTLKFLPGNYYQPKMLTTKRREKKQDKRFKIITSDWLKYKHRRRKNAIHRTKWNIERRVSQVFFFHIIYNIYTHFGFKLPQHSTGWLLGFAFFYSDDFRAERLLFCMWCVGKHCRAKGRTKKLFKSETFEFFLLWRPQVN